MSVADPSGLEKQLARLESERERLSASVQTAAEALRVAEAERETRVSAIATQRQTRRILVGAGTLCGIAAAAVALYLVMTYVSAESFRAHVTETSGPAPVAQGDACTVALEPAYLPHNASMRIDCARVPLYGLEHSGQIRCETSEQRAVGCIDEGTIRESGDPRVSFDRHTGRVIVDDGPRWRAVIQLE